MLNVKPEVLLVTKYLVLAFSALLPIVNPLGSALFVLGLVGNAPAEAFRKLARKIAASTVLFLVVVELAGSLLLTFFDISLPVVQLAGGLVVAVMGWRLLNQKEYEANAQEPAIGSQPNALAEKLFYPLTFPVTVGPGCIVVTLTLSARASDEKVVNNVLAHFGILIGIVVVSLLVLICYTYAPKLTQKIAPQTVHGILRVIAFVLLCIGVQIAWNGLSSLLRTLPH